MLWPLWAVAALNFASVANAVAVSHSLLVETTDELQNANHIFNAIHSSMRQWGSSLNHNGMSFFPAVVPAGTQFYHGRGAEEPVQGLEWLAYEPEHALGFSFKVRDPGSMETIVELEQDLNTRTETRSASIAISDYMSKNEDHHSRPEPPRVEPGWLHTYRTKETTPCSTLMARQLVNVT